jgi:hypothetical protein
MASSLPRCGERRLPPLDGPRDEHGVSLASSAPIMTAATAPVAPALPRSPYFVSAAWDFLLMGGASLLCYGIMRLVTENERTEGIIAAGAALAWVINWPHFAATSARLYGSRENLAQYPITAFGAPILVLCGIAASMASPDVIAPWWLKLFMFWSPYHFSGQTVGLTLLYARRTGFFFTPVMRLCLSTFVFCSYLLPIVRFEVSTVGSQYYGINYPGLGIPGWTPDAVTALMVMGAIGFLVLAGKKALDEKRPLPPIVLLPAVTQFVWFLPGGSWATFAEFVPFFHSLQYMLVAWSLMLKEKLDGGGHRASVRFVLGESARWYVLLIIGGGVLFSGLPQLMSRVSGTTIWFSTAVVIAGVQIHHFFVDGVIWKLRSRNVRSPLLGTLDELTGAAAREQR